jgi:hypothetical protein
VKRIRIEFTIAAPDTTNSTDVTRVVERALMAANYTPLASLVQVIEIEPKEVQK